MSVISTTAIIDSVRLREQASPPSTPASGFASLCQRDDGRPSVVNADGDELDFALCAVQVAASDETTALTTGAAKVTFRMPFKMRLLAVRASLTTAQASGSIFTVDVNEGGASILSTKLTIDNGEKTSTTAATPPVISDADLADDAEITIDIDQVGDGTAAGLKVSLIGLAVR